MEFTKVIRLRRSTRGFTNEQITDEQLREILDAAQLAPIAGADYTMSHLTVVQDAALLDEIRTDCLLRRKDGTTLDPLYGAPTIILLSVTGPSDDNIEYCNVACAIENMTLAATNLGLGSVYLWGFLRKLRRHPETIEKLQLPEGYTLLSGIAVGHAATPLEERLPKENIGVNYL